VAVDGVTIVHMMALPYTALYARLLIVFFLNPRQCQDSKTDIFAHIEVCSIALVQAGGYSY
jgi:hypothetical protein